MSKQNVIRFDPNRRVRRPAFLDNSIIVMLIILIFDVAMFAGMVGIFMLTRTAAGDGWPPPEQPWFPPTEVAISSAALLVSGVLVFLAARAWEKREARVGPLLVAAIALGAFFLLSQGALWAILTHQGLALSETQHGNFFRVIVGMHVANLLGALIFMGVAWRRLRPLRDEGDPRGTLTRSTFSAARILWYFSVGVWPILYACLYR